MKKISDLNEKYWNEFYKKNYITSPSKFALFVNNYITTEDALIDVGCGSGRDAYFHAQKCKYVVGIDKSNEVIKANNELVKKKEISNINFITGDLLTQSILKKTIDKLYAEKENGKLIIYLRFLLHSIDERTQKHIFDTCATELNKGDLLALEFRTSEDENRDKNYTNHYRRYIDSDNLNDVLTNQYDFSSVYFTKGIGLSVYEGEDPFLCRMLVKKY